MTEDSHDRGARQAARHPLLLLDRQEAGLEHHQRLDPRPVGPGKIPPPVVTCPTNLGSYINLTKREMVKPLAERPSRHRFDRSPIRPPTRQVSQAGQNHPSRQLPLRLPNGPAVRRANTIVFVPSLRPREPRRFCVLIHGPPLAPFCDIAVVGLPFYFSVSYYLLSQYICSVSLLSG
jgi:hypothetical protein